MLHFGLSPEAIATLRATVGEVLAPAQGAELCLFGSRARGTHRRFSDVDLLVDAQPQLSLKQLGEVCAALEESNLPDVVDVVASSRGGRAAARTALPISAMWLPCDGARLYAAPHCHTTAQ